MSGCCRRYFAAEVACSYGCLAIDRELDPSYLLRVNLSAAGRAHEAEHGTDSDDAWWEPAAAARSVGHDPGERAGRVFRRRGFCRSRQERRDLGYSTLTVLGRLIRN